MKGATKQTPKDMRVLDSDGNPTEWAWLNPLNTGQRSPGVVDRFGIHLVGCPGNHKGRCLDQAPGADSEA